jgi:hypothetical protein
VKIQPQWVVPPGKQQQQCNELEGGSVIFRVTNSYSTCEIFALPVCRVVNISIFLLTVTQDLQVYVFVKF